MGLSVSAATAIIFSGFLVAFAVGFGAVNTFLDNVNEGERKMSERLTEKMQTMLTISNATYNSTGKNLTILIENTGSVSLDVNRVDIVVDGFVITQLLNSQKTRVDGNVTNIWSPSTTLKLVAENLTTSPQRVKVVSENGVSAYTTDIYII